MTSVNVLLRYTDIFPITDFVHLLSSFLVSPPPPFLFPFYLLSIHSSLSPCPILFPFAIIQIYLSFPLVSSFLSVLSSFTFSSHPSHIPIPLLVSFQSFSAFSIPFLPLLLVNVSYQNTLQADDSQEIRTTHIQICTLLQRRESFTNFMYRVHTRPSFLHPPLQNKCHNIRGDNLFLTSQCLSQVLLLLIFCCCCCSCLCS